MRTESYPPDLRTLNLVDKKSAFRVPMPFEVTS